MLHTILISYSIIRQYLPNISFPLGFTITFYVRLSSLLKVKASAYQPVFDFTKAFAIKTKSNVPDSYSGRTETFSMPIIVFNLTGQVQ